MSTSRSSRCVAKEWRSVCVVTRLAMPAAAAASCTARLELPRGQRLHRIEARGTASRWEDLACLRMADAPPGLYRCSTIGLSMA